MRPEPGRSQSCRDRDYYLKDDTKSKEIRAKYEAHIGRMFELAGENPDVASKAAATVMELETKLAKSSFTRVENRDPQKTYNKIDVAEVEKLGSSFEWKAYLDRVGVKKVSEVNVRQPKFFEAFAGLCSNAPSSNGVST